MQWKPPHANGASNLSTVPNHQDNVFMHYEYSNRLLKIYNKCMCDVSIFIHHNRDMFHSHLFTVTTVSLCSTDLKTLHYINIIFHEHVYFPMCQVTLLLPSCEMFCHGAPNLPGKYPPISARFVLWRYKHNLQGYRRHLTIWVCIKSCDNSPCWLRARLTERWWLHDCIIIAFLPYLCVLVFSVSMEESCLVLHSFSECGLWHLNDNDWSLSHVRDKTHTNAYLPQMLIFSPRCSNKVIFSTFSSNTNATATLP